MMNMMFGMMDICNELYKSERFRSLKKTMHDPKKGPIAPCNWEPYTADKPVHRKIIDCSSSITFVLGAFFTAYWHGLHNLTCSQYVAPTAIIGGKMALKHQTILPWKLAFIFF